MWCRSFTRSVSRFHTLTSANARDCGAARGNTVLAEIVPHECVKRISERADAQVIDVFDMLLSQKKRAQVIRNLVAEQSSRRLKARRIWTEGNTRALSVQKQLMQPRRQRKCWMKDKLECELANLMLLEGQLVADEISDFLETASLQLLRPLLRVLVATVRGEVRACAVEAAILNRLDCGHCACLNWSFSAFSSCLRASSRARRT